MSSEEDQAIYLADVALKTRRISRRIDAAFLRLRPAERKVLRLRFKDDPTQLARFDALEGQED